MSELLTEEEAAAVLKVSESWLKKRRHAGDGPPFHKLGERLIRYDRAAVLEWASSYDETGQFRSNESEATQ